MEEILKKANFEDLRGILKTYGYHLNLYNNGISYHDSLYDSKDRRTYIMNIEEWIKDDSDDVYCILEATKNLALTNTTDFFAYLAEHPEEYLRKEIFKTKKYLRKKMIRDYMNG